MGGLTGTRPALRARQELIGAMPAVNAVLGRLGFDAIVREHLPPRDPRCLLDAAAVTGVMVRNLATGREPLYGLAQWAARFEPAQLGLEPGQAALVNDDRAGRVLDALSAADRASMMTALALAAVRGWAISTSELHNDSTSVVLYGAYQPRPADSPGQAGGPAGPGDASAGPGDGGARVVPRPARGHSKDHRADLKQLVHILTVTADGAVPVTARMADGNTQDATTHIATWEECARIAGHAGFLYVADCKLASTAAMTYIHQHGGRFVTILPRNRLEDAAGRDAIAAGKLSFTPAAQRPAAGRGRPPDTWHTAPAAASSAEGFQVIWVRSSVKHDHDARSRRDRVTSALSALEQLAGKLGTPGCRLRTEQAIRRAAGAAAAPASRWVSWTLDRHDTITRRQIGRGHPGMFTRYREVTTTRWTLAITTDDALIARDAASDGTFPLITNDHGLTPARALAAYKHQPRIERRHSTFKTALHGAPLTLNTPARIDALAFCLCTALLIHALTERDLRTAAAAAGISALPLYPEYRPAPAPSGTLILTALAPIAATILTSPDGTSTTLPPQLTTLQQQIITLLRINPASYHQHQKQDL